LLCAHSRSPKKVHTATQHDIKLELDVRCQNLIQKALRQAFPELPVLGEEGAVGDPDAPARWVVDPIDGTVNFTYGIPHACVAIALQARAAQTQNAEAPHHCGLPGPNPALYQSVLGVVYDPFCDELWTALRGGPARLNGRRIQVSNRRRLAEAVVSVGFAKERSALEKMLPAFNDLVHRVRKIRIMGSAALGLAYVATGRMDAYLEYGLSLWDIAAGGLLVECAGGQFDARPIPDSAKFSVVATNGLVSRALRPWAT
jgi:myo-inositol-1(or 4)-monophosphatase